MSAKCGELLRYVKLRHQVRTDAILDAHLGFLDLPKPRKSSKLTQENNQNKQINAKTVQKCILHNDKL